MKLKKELREEKGRLESDMRKALEEEDRKWEEKRRQESQCASSALYSSFTFVFRLWFKV